MSAALDFSLFVVKAALYGAVLLAIGAGLHTALGISADRQRGGVILIAGAFVGLVLALARLVLTSAAIGSIDTANLSLAWLTQGAAVGALALGSALALFSARLATRWPKVAAAGALAASFALTGHAQGLEHPLLTPIAVWLHVTLAGFWIAAPVSLWPAASAELLIPRLERFSAVALGAVPVLFVIGLALLIRLAGDADAILTSSYGRLLLGKLAAATCALALGAYNKISIPKDMRREHASAVRRLKITLTSEAALFAMALLLLAAATTFVGPGNH